MDQIKKAGTGALTLAALGVVYGDIGTSPLYAFKEAFVGPHGLAPTEPNVLATLSALFWAMMLIISIKYVWIMLKYDNDGEGGVLALTALANRVARGDARWKTLIITAGIFAAALFYGDALITPAISVLSAIEGLSVATPAFENSSFPSPSVYWPDYSSSSDTARAVWQVVRSGYAIVVRGPGSARRNQHRAKPRCA